MSKSTISLYNADCYEKIKEYYEIAKKRIEDA